MTDQARIDHLVVLADTLEQGAAWCERSLGVPPGPGGEHPLMGTHNRLLRLASVDHPLAYFEVIARNPAAEGAQAGRRRWFDMDDAAVQSTVREHGPRLAHWVARVPDVRAACCNGRSRCAPTDGGSSTAACPRSSSGAPPIPSPRCRTRASRCGRWQ